MNTQAQLEIRLQQANDVIENSSLTLEELHGWMALADSLERRLSKLARQEQARKMNHRITAVRELLENQLHYPCADIAVSPDDVDLTYSAWHNACDWMKANLPESYRAYLSETQDLI